MDHLNYFTPYQSRLPGHEDQLTRAFLVVLRLIPLAQVSFLDLVRCRQIEARSEHLLPAFSELGFEETVIETQVTTTNHSSGRLISVAITNQEWQPQETVQPTHREARYDGVIAYRPDWILLLENKPYTSDTNELAELQKKLPQMDPKLGEGSEVVVDPVGIVVSWRAVIDRFSWLLGRELVHGAERTVMNDFLLYVDQHFPHLNPFDKFSLCKDNEYLLSRRCQNLMEAVAPGRVKYHFGWKHSVILPSGPVREIYVFPDMQQDGGWRIALALFPGDTIAQAREFFEKVVDCRFLDLAARGWDIAPNMHFAFMATNLCWTQTSLKTEGYFRFWLNKERPIQQARRDATDFRSLFDALLAEGLIGESDLPKLDAAFKNTKRNSVNLCPGFSLYFRWSKQEACELDDKGRFVDVMRDRIEEALSTWGQRM